MLVYNGEGRLFLGRRTDSADAWQFPQGGVDAGTSLEENVLRELEEELGAPRSSFRIERKLQATNEYEFQNPPAYAIGRWRGQSQTFWLVEFTGTDEEITLESDHREFSAWAWHSPAEVRLRAEPRRLPGYEPALREYEEFLQNRRSNRRA